MSDESFKVRGEDDGKVFTVHVYHRWIDMSSDNDPMGRARGLDELFLDDGRHVNKIDDNTFQIPGGQRLKRVIA